MHKTQHPEDRHEDQIQTVSTFDVLNDTASSVDGFNPKYQGRLKASTGMFPTYHPTYEEKKVQRTMRKQVSRLHYSWMYFQQEFELVVKENIRGEGS